LVSARQVYAMLENQSLWDTAAECHQLLESAGISHAVMGGVAICLYGYQRNTIDLDLLVRAQDTEQIRSVLKRASFVWHAESSEFRSPSGIPVQFLLAGDRAGSGSEVRLPDPSLPGLVTEIEGLPVLSLAKLIESKLAAGQTNLRRTHKDFADVVELIAQNGLGSGFAKSLHKSLRPAFRQLVKVATSGQ
jgi:hypothetical protein